MVNRLLKPAATSVRTPAGIILISSVLVAHATPAVCRELPSFAIASRRSGRRSDGGASVPAGTLVSRGGAARRGRRAARAAATSPRASERSGAACSRSSSGDGGSRRAQGAWRGRRTRGASRAARATEESLASRRGGARSRGGIPDRRLARGRRTFGGR